VQFGGAPTRSDLLDPGSLVDRIRHLQEAGLSYVMPFENRGVEMGATLQHPHSQVYGYGFLPQRQAHATKVLQEH
jgi:UDPglucose--hexose-1-phosphate uridylyltransferase